MPSWTCFYNKQYLNKIIDFHFEKADEKTRLWMVPYFIFIIIIII